MGELPGEEGFLMPEDFIDDVNHNNVPRHVHRDIRSGEHQNWLKAQDADPNAVIAEPKSLYGKAITAPKWKVYIIGSLRNPKIPHIGNTIRRAGFSVFDDWHSVGPECDDKWKDYEAVRGRSYLEALEGEHANAAFNFDLKHLVSSQIGVLVLPAGKSGHMEFGLFCQRKSVPMKFGYVLFEEEPAPDRFDLMYKLADGLFFDVDALVKRMKEVHR
jgi:hypothetical protein